MTYGWVVWIAAVFWFFAPALPVFAQTGHKAVAKRESGSADMAATLTAVDAQTVQATRGDGSTLTAAVTASSLCLRNGLLAAPTDFAAGEAVHLRLRFASGSLQIVLLSDLASDAGIARCRRHPLTGSVQSAGPQTLVLLPDRSPDGVPVTLRLSPKTLCATPTASLAPGTSVTVLTRGLADGMLAATVITESGLPTPPAAPHALSGTVTDIQPATNTLTVADKQGTRHVIAVDDATRIKVRKQPAGWLDIQIGMHISARFGSAQDAAGNPLATSLSASDK